MTIGTSIICGSFFFIIHPPRRPALPPSAPKHRLHSSGSVESGPRLFQSTRTGDKENRGSSRCGFLFGFYRGPHPLSNERAPLRTSVLTVEPVLPTPGSLPRRRPRFSRDPRFVPAIKKTLHHAPPAPAVQPEAGAGPSSSGLPSSCLARPEPAGRARGADQSAGRPT